MITSRISFENQVAIVTGAGRGLGRAYALELARRGASVVINDLGLTDDGQRSADQVVEEIKALGGSALASNHDVATVAGGQALVDAAIERFGTLDVLINNAGFLRGSTFEDMKTGDLEAVIGVHLLGAFYVTLPAWTVMRDKGYGRIVMTGSNSSFGHSGNSNYAAAKSGMLGLTHSLALEGRAFGINVNCIFPVAKSQIASKAPLVGPERDRLIAALGDLDGHHTPASVSHLVVYLASKACSDSGRTYSACAGRYARVFLGLSDGWFAGDADVSMEALEQHWKEINDISSFWTPGNLIEELERIGGMIRDRIV